ncbi:MAG TPA: transcriptional regulator NrdR [Candidatus Udaeobacter sp.]|nr:transcriptional regulator NrdR [Candidatus Udaeobacter sp.]
MKCPACGYLEDRVIDSRATKEGSAIRRRRECLKCAQRFTTYEEIELGVVYVIKRDGRREAFDRSKLWGGIRRAAEKRPIPAALLEAAVDRVESRLRESGLGEVRSQAIGEEVMVELRAIDEVAYVRFASVYRHFQDASQFMDEVQSLRAGDAAGEGPGDDPRPAD